MARNPISSLSWPAAKRPSLLLAAIEVTALFLGLALTLFWAGRGSWAILLAIALILGWPAWAAYATIRQASPSLPPKKRIIAFALLQLATAAIAVAGLGELMSLAWLGHGYRVSPGNIADVAFAPALDSGLLAILSAAVSLLAAAAFVMSLPLLRRDIESYGDCFRQIRERGPGTVWPAVAAWLLLGMAANALAAVTAAVAAPPRALQPVNPLIDTEGWRTLGDAPEFTAAVLAVAVLLASFRRVQPEALLSLRVPSRVTTVRPVGLLAVLGSLGAVCGWYFHILHLGMVVEAGPNAMIVIWGDITRATNTWLDAQQAAGRDPAESAAELTEHGYWTVGGAPTGLPALFPELGTDLAGLGMREGCSVTLGAGVADNSALPAGSWLEAYVAAYRPLPDVSYCIRIACPSPAIWHEGDTVILHSSHPSRQEGWSYNLFMDYHGTGQAPGPGGHCNADGTLSVLYRG